MFHVNFVSNSLCLTGVSDTGKELQACAGLWVEVKKASNDVSNKQQRVFITIAQLKAMCERLEWASKVSLQ